jgi:RNA polymerase sigma factor (TIGR02999 family)
MISDQPAEKGASRLDPCVLILADYAPCWSLAAQVSSTGMKQITQVLIAIEHGEPGAASQLLPLVYDQLRHLAAQKLAQEKPGQTLDATALVHEAYLRLVDGDQPRSFRDRNHFLAAAAVAMRHILIDNARLKQARKRGGELIRAPLEDIPAPLPDEELLSLDEALRKLAELDPVKAQLVELRFFGGLTSDQAAEVLGISPSTADRFWAYARAWLQAEVRG